MRFGVLNFPIGPYERIVERFRRFESIGFDDGWLADDLLLSGYADFEPWTLLGAIAQQTNRLRLGTLITTVRLRHSFAEIGIEWITFYWPSIDDQLDDRTPDAASEARFERIAGERIGRRDRS